MGQERREVHVTGGNMNERKEERVGVSKWKQTPGVMTGRKEVGKKGTTKKAADGKVNDQVGAIRRSSLRQWLRRH